MSHTKKGMLPCLPVDVWSILIRFLSFDDVCQCRETCVHVWNALSHLEWEVAVIMSETVLNDTTFWPRAYRRPVETCAGLETWHAEVVRLCFHLKRCPTMTARTLYRMWELIDGVDATVDRAPPRPPPPPLPPPRPCARPCPCRR